MISMKMLQEWIEYTQDVDKKNREITNHNKTINNKINSEIEHYQKMVEKYEDKIKEWKDRSWRDYFEDQPIAPDQVEAKNRVVALEHQMKGTIYPDFTGFMNYMIKQKGMLDGRK